MSEKQGRDGDGRVSKIKLAVGAASLFLFIIGVKRSFRMEEVQEPAQAAEAKAASARRGEAPRAGERRRQRATRATR